MSHKLQSHEIYLGALYGLLQLFVLPQLAVLINHYVQLPLWALNCCLFFLNFICTTAIFSRFLWDNLRESIRTPWLTLRYAGQGLIFYYLLSALVGWVIFRICPDFVNLNDANVTGMTAQGGVLMVLSTVLFAPVAEEVLFRGLLFRGLYDRSPIAAWAVSTAAFSLVHIAGYLGRYEPLTLLLAFIQYLPAGLCLAYAYRKSDTILAPIIMHIAINQVALSIA